MPEPSLLGRLLSGLGLSRAAAPVAARASRPTVLDAFVFRSPLTLPQMKPRLEAGTPWPWFDGDSAYFDYLGARIGPDARMLRLRPEDGRFVLEVRRGPLDDDLRALILGTILPLLGAEDVAPAEGFD